MKDLFNQAKANPLIAIPAVLMVVLLIGGIVLFAALSGDGGGGESGTKTEEDEKGDKDSRAKRGKKRKVKLPPVISGAGTLDVARSIGRFAIAQGRGRIKNPSSISVRVSAAPKQEITVDYQLSCYKEGSGAAKLGQDRYRTRPPNTRTLPLPISGANECTVTVGAQLTSQKPGRVKVTILSG